jgi:hypothetical protein
MKITSLPLLTWRHLIHTSSPLNYTSSIN